MIEEAGGYRAPTASKILEQDFKISKLTEQMSHMIKVCDEVRNDVKMVLFYVERQKERDLMYEKWMRSLPVLFAVISAAYWILSRTIK